MRQQATGISAFLLLLAGSLAGCGTSATTDPPVVPGGTTNPGTSVGGYVAGLQTSGDVGFEDRADRADRVLLSAPITPRTDVIYPAEGKIPADPAAEAALAHSASLTYGWLLAQCAAKYPGIVVPAAGVDLTAAQRATNFNLAAQCSYEQYSAKPYWIPKLVNDVDICGKELGPQYRLPKESDLADLRDADYKLFADTLTTASGGFGGFYFSLQIWLRGADGKLKIGDLSVGAAARVLDLPVDSSSQLHLEGSRALRCIRREARGQ